MMRWKYSKPSVDVENEALNIEKQDRYLQRIVSETTAALKINPVRRYCVLCNKPLDFCEDIYHRSIKFKQCKNCGHVQSFNSVTDAYESLVSKTLGYDEIYPNLSSSEYESRCARVYEPKANWVFQCLSRLDIEPLNLRWCDVGCGSGMFLKALQNSGVSQFKGFDVDEHNLSIARQFVGTERIEKNTGGVERIFDTFEADIYTSFFVLEHIENMDKIIDALSRKRSGTFFAFAVPVFGFITMFESVVESHYPRSLDGMLHTQIFTEASISYFLEASGYEVMSEWHFGQDATDFYRFLSGNIKNLYPEEFRNDLLKKLKDLVDPIQTIVDRGHLSDSRHILAIKR